MKIFVFVFSIYIMALSLMPCSDAMTCENKKSSTTTNHSKHDHSEDESDLCTPFCICACCGGTAFVVTVPQFFMNEVRLETPVFITPYHSDFNSSYCHSFWQPPKLG